MLIALWVQGTNERLQYIKMGEVITLENGDVQANITNKGMSVAKNIRLSCEGRTAAGDAMNGDIVFYDTIGPNETKSLTSKEMIQQNFGNIYNISLYNIKTIQCQVSSVEMNLSGR